MCKKRQNGVFKNKNKKAKKEGVINCCPQKGNYVGRPRYKRTKRNKGEKANGNSGDFNRWKSKDHQRHKKVEKHFVY